MNWLKVWERKNRDWPQKVWGGKGIGQPQVWFLFSHLYWGLVWKIIVVWIVRADRWPMCYLDGYFPIGTWPGDLSHFPFIWGSVITTATRQGDVLCMEFPGARNGDEWVWMVTYPPETGSRFLEIFQIFSRKYRWHPVFFVEQSGILCWKQKTQATMKRMKKWWKKKPRVEWWVFRLHVSRFQEFALPKIRRIRRIAPNWQPTTLGISNGWILALKKIECQSFPMTDP